MPEQPAQPRTTIVGEGRAGLPISRVAVFAGLTLFGVTAAVPFVWQILMSLATLTDVDLLTQTGFPPTLLPSNYGLVFERVPFAKYFFNSFFVAGWVTILQVITCAMAAYAFSRVQWPGREKVFLLYLGTLMIPGVVLMVPNFAVVLGLGMFNSYWGLIIPGAFSAFGTFMLRQFMLTIPTSLDEAAAIDGAGHWRIFTEVVLPLARPGVIVLAIFCFLGNYNSFFWPLILVKDVNLRTLPLGLLVFDSSYGRETPLIMAASLMAMVPPVVIFLLLNRYLVKGIQLGAVKG
ncbi:MAG: carbohydrate ABC transporter permease [Phycisphaerales bacterium]|nr:carbohydrate ABC transporter permease [Phycisphaerales bacterium]